MTLVPITLREANDFIRQYHRHNKPGVGARFCLAAEEAGEIVGVAVIGRTTARLLHGPKVAELTRVCSKPTAPKNTCSFLYAAGRRVWQSMGGERLITYTLQSESGASLRAAGFAIESKLEGGQWNRPNRSRQDQPVCSEPKLRWTATPSGEKGEVK